MGHRLTQYRFSLLRHFIQKDCAMSQFSRRDFLGSAAAVSLVAAQEADAMDFPFKNNVPDPHLAGKELPTFKFALEKSKGKVDGGNFGKQATVEELPISKGIA